MATTSIGRRTRYLWHLWLAALLMGAIGACGDDDDDSTPANAAAVDATEIAGTWNGTLNIEGDGEAFAVTFDCTGAFTGTVGGVAVSGQVTSFDPDTGVFDATMTVGSETRTLAGVVNVNTLTGSFTSDTGPAGNFVVSFAAGSALVCNFSLAGTATLVMTVASSTCTGTGDAPYAGSGAALFTPNDAGGVDVVISLEGPPQVAIAGTSDDDGREISFAGSGLPDGAALTVTLSVNTDGETLTGTFAGSNDDCSELSGTFTGTFD
ncbi:MAG TPA: hypothetical protein VGB12_05900 [bacterium]|jgi:hypothetical protein